MLSVICSIVNSDGWFWILIRTFHIICFNLMYWTVFMIQKTYIRWLGPSLISMKLVRLPIEIRMTAFEFKEWLLYCLILSWLVQNTFHISFVIFLSRSQEIFEFLLLLLQSTHNMLSDIEFRKTVAWWRFTWVWGSCCLFWCKNLLRWL